MKILSILLVIFCSKGSLATAPAEFSSHFARVQPGVHGTAAQHRALASSVEQSKWRCAKKCSADERCWQFCYGPATGQCVLEDATVVSQSATRAKNCTRYTKQGKGVSNNVYEGNFL